MRSPRGPSSDVPLVTPDPREYPRRFRTALRQLARDGPGPTVRHALGRLRLFAQLRRYAWHPRRLVRSLDGISIDRPVFLLGVPGGGATILARVLYRHPDTVYASGNSSFWAGPDEIQKCRHLTDLPETLRLRSAHYYNLDSRVEEHPVYGFQRTPLYAIDEFLDRYRRGSSDADAATRDAFRRVLRRIILAYAHDPGRARFVDMSHLFTVQVEYIASLLEGSDPRFLLLVRNPYVVCQRTVDKDLSRMGTRRELTREERIACAVESWHNSYRVALESLDRVRMRIERYEDFVSRPEQVGLRVFRFAELTWDPDLLPRPHHRLPLGSNSVDKWYPLRSDENERYLPRLRDDLVSAVNRRCGELIERFGYERLEPGSPRATASPSGRR